ncbi:hypothetical protein COLO4_37742 [Corchorus olitorius]|uniref:Uncharacterized protein n=1 Tax=Corchorus olitorius TaxID=93759 RepID=A0A1R3FZM5_9ROSI|nr:hypothetical protein COLO4_37742 [Corchorus olitorius]
MHANWVSLPSLFSSLLPHPFLVFVDANWFLSLVLPPAFPC